MDKALVYETSMCRFESYRGRCDECCEDYTKNRGLWVRPPPPLLQKGGVAQRVEQRSPNVFTLLVVATWSRTPLVRRPPCHGGDARFDSGRDRCGKCPWDYTVNPAPERAWGFNSLRPSLMGCGGTADTPEPKG